jgi:hypothetical protein
MKQKTVKGFGLRNKPTDGTVIGHFATRGQAREQARRVFLDAIPRVEPRIWQELLELYPLYEAAAAHRSFVGWTPLTYLVGFEGELYTPGKEHIHDARAEHAFINALDAWGKKYNLTDVWIMEWAIRAINADGYVSEPLDAFIGGEKITLTSSRSNTRLPSASLISLHRMPPDPEPPKVPAWSNLWRSEKEYRERVEQIINEYIEEAKKDRLEWDEDAQDFNKYGITETPELPNPDHCEWLVMFQCLGLGYADIAHQVLGKKIKDSTYRNTIIYGVKSVQEKIGITLRTVKAGRPKGKKNSR